jgi:hypothetical protein
MEAFAPEAQPSGPANHASSDPHDASGAKAG